MTGGVLAAALLLICAVAAADEGSALIAAVQREKLPRVIELLGRGADVNARSAYGATPLFFACDKGNLEIVELLLEHGADVDVTDSFYGTTPARWTLYYLDKGPEYVDILVRLLGRVRQGSGDVEAALMAGVEHGLLKVVRAAVEKGQASPSALVSALAAARAAGRSEIARYLSHRAPEADDSETARSAPETQTPSPAVTASAQPETRASSSPLPAPVRGRAMQWPAFRGPGRSGIADGQGVPGEWNGSTGRNIRWRTAVPGLGLSSPVIWDDRIFLTTSIAESGDASLRTGLYGDVGSVADQSIHVWRVMALDRRTGDILWQRDVHRGRPEVKRHFKSSHANATPATDGRHLVVSFGSEGVYGFDLEGRLLWQKDFGTLSSGWFYDPTYEWEFGSSPILWRGRVIVQVDVQQGSFVAAQEAATGDEVWRTARDEIPSWGTPVILVPGEGSGPAELVTNARTIRGYDAETGAELWRLRPNSEITVASPVVAEGAVFVTGGYPPARPIYAIRPGGRGDISLPEGKTSSPAILWSEPRGGTYIPTPIVYRGLLFVLHNNGRLATYEAADGDPVYQGRVGDAESFAASPIAADGRLFFTSEDGATHVVRAGRRFELLGTNQLDEVVMATPAASGGLLVVRGQRHLYGIGEPPASSAPQR